MTLNPLLRPFTDWQLVEELVERGLVVEAWATTSISDLDREMMKFDWRKMVDETNIHQLVYCEPFIANLLRKETADEASTIVTHTILILKQTEDTRDLPSRR